MNNLSWFLYLTQVADGAKVFICVTSGLALLAVGITAIPACIGKFDSDMGTGKFYDDIWRPLARKIIPGALALIFIANLIPDRRTFLLIAASEIGDRALNSESVKDVVSPGVDLLKTWIKRETDKLKEATK
jgi:hypothetical protein